jgi:hypothetical protein
MSYWVYDIETYPNCFTFCAAKDDGTEFVGFECSSRMNQVGDMFEFLDKLRKNKDHLVGFNNLDFDYPVVHDLLSVREKALTVGGKAVAVRAYKKAMKLINSEEKFGRSVKTKDEHITQIDLYKINHFDNKARSTGLKSLEFNMRSESIEDLPFEVGTHLDNEQIEKLLRYNMHDVTETLKFLKLCMSQIEFRHALTDKYGKSFLNHNDTKIGKDYFIMRLEQEMPGSVYKKGGGINQTKRDSINIGECLFNYYDFQHASFNAVLEWFRSQSIKETKGVFSDLSESDLGACAKFAHMYTKKKKIDSEATFDKLKADMPLAWLERRELKAKKAGVNLYSLVYCYNFADNLNVVVDGFRFDFGTGGIHGSVESTVVREDDEYMIVDADVASMYPNIAIANRVYPEHLSEKFCDIYEDVYNQRKSYAKGTPENAMLKLALNGVYGDSNNPYSAFYDPKYTMTITINGQLSLCLLAEKLMGIEGLQMVQVNTDGVTVKLPRNKRQQYDDICAAWQKQVGLELEFAEYSAMFIRDCNNYVAVYTNGKVKRKGVYQYENLGWHQDHSALVVAKAAEAHMLHGTNIKSFIHDHEDVYDFMLRAKVPRNSKLFLIVDNVQHQQQNTCRYYMSRKGGKLVKVMPALEENGEPRQISVAADYTVKVCNDISNFEGDIDVRYYVDEAQKLVIT